MMEQNENIKLGVRLSEDGIKSRDKASEKLNMSRSKIIDVLVRKLELNTIKDDFDFYSIKVRK
jgi:hypothetical protein